MTWQELEKEIQTLSEKMQSFSPEIIVGVVRGGMIPARLIATSLGVKKMYCLSVEKDGNERKVTTEIVTDIKNKKVLLIEDMLETGKSIIVAKEYLESQGAIVKTACLYIMPISEITPDYYLRSVDRVETFPWEAKP